MKIAAHFATLLFAFPFLILDFLAFDRLVRYEYENFREAWEQNGCPLGFFWKPPNSRFFTSPMRYMARDRCAVMWLFVTPNWMQQDTRALSLVSRLRWLWLAFVFVGMPALLLANIALMD